MTEHVETLVGLIFASGQGAPVSAAPLASIPKWAFIDISSSYSVGARRLDLNMKRGLRLFEGLQNSLVA
jgi:hypothetical protein